MGGHYRNFVATIISAVILMSILLRRAGEVPQRGEIQSWQPLEFRGILPFAIEYGLFVLITNTDILIAYLVLSNQDLGVYAASSVLPKAIVTATQPVSQIMLPVMKAMGGNERPRTAAFLKAIAICAVFSVAGAALLFYSGNLVCNERFGIRFCSPSLLGILALSAIPLGLIRIQVVARLALDNRRHFIFPFVALFAFGLLTVIWIRSPEALASTYATFCWLFVIVSMIMIFACRQMATWDA